MLFLQLPADAAAPAPPPVPFAMPTALAFERALLDARSGRPAAELTAALAADRNAAAWAMRTAELEVWAEPSIELEDAADVALPTTRRLSWMRR